MDPATQPGALSYTRRPENQEDSLARQFHKTVFPLIQFQVPTYFLEFPRPVDVPDDLFARLQTLMNDHGVSHPELLEAHDGVARPELVHDFQDHAAGSRILSLPPGRTGGEVSEVPLPKLMLSRVLA